MTDTRKIAQIETAFFYDAMLSYRHILEIIKICILSTSLRNAFFTLFTK